MTIGCAFAVVAVEFGVGSLDEEAAAVRHGIAGVHGQIHDDLFHLAGVGANGAEVGEVRMTSSMSSPIRRGMSLPMSSTTVLRLSDARLQNLHAAESEELARQRGRAIGGAVDLFDFAGDGIAGRQNVQQQLGVALDDHQEIVEVVRDAAGEATDGFHFLRLAKLVFE